MWKNATKPRFLTEIDTFQTRTFFLLSWFSAFEFF